MPVVQSQRVCQHVPYPTTCLSDPLQHRPPHLRTSTAKMLDCPALSSAVYPRACAAAERPERTAEGAAAGAGEGGRATAPPAAQVAEPGAAHAPHWRSCQR